VATIQPPGGPGWCAVTFLRIPRHTVYARVDGAPRARSDCAASGLLIPLADVGLEQTPVRRWRVGKTATSADPHTRAGGDYAARVYVLFRFDASHATLASGPSGRFSG